MIEEMALQMTGKEPQELRREWQRSDAPRLRRRRRIIGLSLFGIGVTALISMFQTGVVEHLPDLPVEGFDSEKVMSSDPAYMFSSLGRAAAHSELAHEKRMLKKWFDKTIVGH